MKSNDFKKPKSKAKGKKTKRRIRIPREYYFDEAGHKIIQKIGFYWAMNHTKGVRGIYHQHIYCTICGRFDNDGYLYQASEHEFVALCSRCKRNMKNGPGLHIIYRPMK